MVSVSSQVLRSLLLVGGTLSGSSSMRLATFLMGLVPPSRVLVVLAVISRDRCRIRHLLVSEIAGFVW